MAETNALITAALNVHLNIGQNLTINTSSVFVSMETAPIASLPNKIVQQMGGGRIRLSSNITILNNQSDRVFIRVRSEQSSVERR